MSEVVTLLDIHRALQARPAGDSISLPKSEIPSLPREFRESFLGTPPWIAHPGASRQFRGPGATHAYELSDRFEVHRDKYDPKTDPLGHIIFDAPELVIATGVATLLSAVVYIFLEKLENKRPGEQRRPWFSIAMSAIVGTIAWFLFYVIFAMLRVALGRCG